MTMRIIAIDPGYERLGIAIIEPTKQQKDHLVYSECFKTSAKLPFSERLLLLGQRVAELIEQHEPELMVLENVYFSNNQKTAIQVAEAKGVIQYVAKAAGLRVEQLTPLQIKQSLTGYGKATKDQVAHMVTQLIDADVSAMIDDEVDAIAVGITGCSFFKS